MIVMTPSLSVYKHKLVAPLERYFTFPCFPGHWEIFYENKWFSICKIPFEAEQDESAYCEAKCYFEVMIQLRMAGNSSRCQPYKYHSYNIYIGNIIISLSNFFSFHVMKTDNSLYKAQSIVMIRVHARVKVDGVVFDYQYQVKR